MDTHHGFEIEELEVGNDPCACVSEFSFKEAA